MTEDIGQQLAQARQARALTLEQVSRMTRMRLHYLQALEAGDFSALPSLAQARGFLRTYATFLGLDAVSLLASLNGERQLSTQPTPAAEAGSRPANGTASSGVETSHEEIRFIFEEVGERLKQQRELLGLSIEDVERHTHLRGRYLHALEAGKLDDLPSPVQGRGMLKNYAGFLGLDPDPLLLRFAEGLQARLAVKQAAQPRTAPEVNRQRLKAPSIFQRLLTGDLLIGAVLVISLAGFTVWGAVRIFALRGAQEQDPTPPSIAEMLDIDPTASLTPTPPASEPAPAQAAAATQPPTPEATEAISEEETPEAEATGAEGDSQPLQGTSGGVQVYITVHQRAWMRVTVDGEVEFEGRVLPGSAYEFSGEEQVAILTGNAAALQVFFDQQDLGPLGLFGQVVNRVFTVAGVETPTPTITPTGSPTPRTSPTQEATPTLRSIITATP